MEIVVNTTAKTNQVTIEFEKAVEKIKANAESGISETELYLPIHVSGDVKEELEKEDKGIDFCIVDRRPNPYTGKMNHFVSKKINESTRYYKVRI